MASTGRIRIYTEKKDSPELLINKPIQKRISKPLNTNSRLPPPPRRHRLVQSSYRGYTSPTTNVSTSATAVATAAAYAAYNRHNANNGNSLLGNNNTVNIVAAAATGYGNNISSALKNNNPALKSLSLSSNTSLSKKLNKSPKNSPSLNTSLEVKESSKETNCPSNDYTRSTNEKTKEPTSPTQNKENISNNFNKKKEKNPSLTKHKNTSNSSINSNGSCKSNCHSNSKINHALKLLSESDQLNEDDVKGIELRKEAVEVLKDYKFDKSTVAQLYQIGLHYVYEKDYQKAYDIFKEAHNYHYPAATFQLARYYESGILESVPKDNKIAQKYYRQAALNSYCKAMYRLSMAYLHGEIGCRKSKKESICWLHRCTWSIDNKEQMVVGEAMYQLSKFYEQGMTNDKEKDLKSAASYLRMAAEKYCVEAQDYLGYCYQHGHLTYPCNLKKALYWFTQAAIGHCIESKISLCHLYLTGSSPDIPQEDSEALYWIRRAANSTHVNNCTQRFSRAKAQYILGWLYEEGLDKILEKNSKEAIKWYLKANLEGVPDAKSALKHFSQDEINEVMEEEKQNEMAQHNSEDEEKPTENERANSECSDNNSTSSGRSGHSLNMKLMNIASSLLEHSHLKSYHSSHHESPLSNTSEPKTDNTKSINDTKSAKSKEKKLSHENQESTQKTISSLNETSSEKNTLESMEFSSDDTLNMENTQDSLEPSIKSVHSSKDTLNSSGPSDNSKDIHNNNSDIEDHHDPRNHVLSEKEKKYIEKLNSELVKSMMIVKSEPNSPYITPFNNSSSYISDDLKEQTNLSKNLEFNGSESVCSSSCSSSYSSLFSDECSSCCYSCSTCSTNVFNPSKYICNHEINSTSSVTSEEGSVNNFDTLSQDSSLSSYSGYDNQNIKNQIHSSQKFSGYDKSQITSSDRMKAYSHYKKTMYNKQCQSVKSLDIALSEEKMNNSKKLKRRHSHSGVSRYKISPMTPLNDENNLHHNKSGLKQRSKSSININEHRLKSKDEEDDSIRVHHIKGLSDTESEISYVCPYSSNIFDTFEKKEEHHDYGYNNERHKSKPKAVVKSCQHCHHSPSPKHKHHLTLGHGHLHHHHHHHQHHHDHQHPNHHHHRSHSLNRANSSSHSSLLKFNLHSLTLTSLPSKSVKSEESLDLQNTTNSDITLTKEKEEIKAENITKESKEINKTIIQNKSNSNEKETPLNSLENLNKEVEKTTQEELNNKKEIKPEIVTPAQKELETLTPSKERIEKEEKSVVSPKERNIKSLEISTKAINQIKSNKDKSESPKPNRILHRIKSDIDEKLHLKKDSNENSGGLSPTTSKLNAKLHHLSLFGKHHHQKEHQEQSDTSSPKENKNKETINNNHNHHGYHHHTHHFLSKLNTLHIYHSHDHDSNES